MLTKHVAAIALVRVLTPTDSLLLICTKIHPFFAVHLRLQSWTAIAYPSIGDLFLTSSNALAKTELKTCNANRAYCDAEAEKRGWTELSILPSTTA